MTTPTLITLPFHGHPLVTFEMDGEHHAAMKPIAEGIGLAWHGQFERIKRNPILSEGIRVIRIPSEGGPQEMVSLPLRLLNGWLFGIDVDRVKPELRDTILTYQRECYDVLYRHWHTGRAVNPRAPAVPEYPATGSPFDNVQASKLGKLQRTNKSMALAYLVECGVTPEYVQSVLSRHGALPYLSAPSTSPDQMPAPIEHLAREVPLNYDRQDDLHWYLLRETFTRICGDYDVTATGRMLASRGLLSRGQDSLTKRLNAKPWGFGEHGKISFFAIRKRLAQFAATPASPDRPQPNQDGRNGL